MRICRWDQIFYRKCKSCYVLLKFILVFFFSIAVLSVFSEIHFKEKQKNRKRQRSPIDSITSETEPLNLEVGVKYEVRLSIVIRCILCLNKFDVSFIGRTYSKFYIKILEKWFFYNF